MLTSLAWGHEGGNNLTAQIVNAGAAKALSVTVAGNAITVHAATDATGAITSTAAQVVDAINANTGAAALVTASKYRTNTGAGVVRHAASSLSDCLRAPTSQPRGPIRSRACASATTSASAGREGRRLHLLPGARPRVGHAAGLPRDR